MEWLTRQPIAHRGLHGGAIAENTIAAFQAAVDAGYPIELDVNLTRDEVPIVYHHPPSAPRGPDRDPIRETTWDEITKRPCGGEIPRFTAALDAINGRVPLLVDVKNWHRTAGPLEEALIDRLDPYDGPFAIQSFNPATLRYVRRHRPAWPRGQIAGRFADAESLAVVERAVLKRLGLTWWSRPQFLAYRHTDLPYWPVSLHRRLGLPVLAWTIRSDAERRHVAPYCDNVIFEQVRP